MYPGHWAKTAGSRPAVIMTESGEVVDHAELDERSTRLANVFRAVGLRPGDHVAVFLPNDPRYVEVAWAALRSGLFLTPVNRYLTDAEAGYIVDNCEARVLVTAAVLHDVAVSLVSRTPDCRLRLMMDGVADGHDPYEAALSAASTEPLPEEPLGELMMYSSGTTGRPKGIARSLSGASAANGLPAAGLLGGLFDMNEASIYLSTAPMYHAAPLVFTLAITALGGTAVIMERFDAEAALAAIERYRVTHSQWVPTMFSRMLNLPDDVRSKFDLSTHTAAIHGAAPCSPAVKRQMFDWWGPILHEYYGGSELNGLTYCAPSDGLARPGTVGRAVLGEIHICDDTGRELPPGEVGLVYFELPARTFEYHKDPAQTRSAEHPHRANWTTLGDLGRLDEDGFLYLSDRASFMIISGGVNIYPQEIEDCLLLHPAVEDVAVIGVPNAEMGEEVKAIVQLMPRAEATEAVATELLAHARKHLAHYKCPRSVDFVDQLPRLPTGKLYKLQIREKFWVGHDSRIV